MRLWSAVLNMIASLLVNKMQHGNESTVELLEDVFFFMQAGSFPLPPVLS